MRKESAEHNGFPQSSLCHSVFLLQWMPGSIAHHAAAPASPWKLSHNSRTSPQLRYSTNSYENVSRRIFQSAFTRSGPGQLPEPERDARTSEFARSIREP
jgi:hypothetical protein